MIHITKNGFQYLEWNAGQQQYVEEEFVAYSCLREGVTEVEEGVTLEDLITFTARDEMLQLIIGAYSGCEVLDFYNELKEGVKPLDPWQDVKYCTVAMAVELTDGNKHKPGKTMNTDYDFHGCGEDKEDKWGLDLSPLTEIAALPFRLEANAAVTRLSKDDYQIDNDYEYIPTLLELLDAIFFDLSFHGSSAEKAEAVCSLKEQVQSINEGTAKLVPLDLVENKEADK